MMPARSALELQAMAKTAARQRKHKPRKRATRPAVVAPSYVPWRCVVLAVDPGNESGWAIYVCGVLVQFGTLDVFDHEHVAKVVLAALRMAELAGVQFGGLEADAVPTVLVIERAFSAGAMRGAARPLWQKAWASAGVSERRIVRAHASRWRSQLFGRGAGAWPKDRARREEQDRAREIAKRGNAPIQHDAAAAICIGAWGVRAAEVGSKLPIKFRFREAG